MGNPCSIFLAPLTHIAVLGKQNIYLKHDRHRKSSLDSRADISDDEKKQRNAFKGGNERNKPQSNHYLSKVAYVAKSMERHRLISSYI